MIFLLILLFVRIKLHNKELGLNSIFFAELSFKKSNNYTLRQIKKEQKNSISTPFLFIELFLKNFFSDLHNWEVFFKLR